MAGVQEVLEAVQAEAQEEAGAVVRVAEGAEAGHRPRGYPGEPRHWRRG